MLVNGKVFMLFGIGIFLMKFQCAGGLSAGLNEAIDGADLFVFGSNYHRIQCPSRLLSQALAPSGCRLVIAYYSA